MNVEHNKQPAGSLKISQEVLATIANFASEEIDGVVSLANTYTPIKNFLKKGSIARPIQISLNDDVAVIDSASTSSTEPTSRRLPKPCKRPLRMRCRT